MTRGGGPGRSGPTYGTYFSAVSRFLEADDFLVLRRAVRRAAGLEAIPETLDEVEVFLEKHGAFYHPGRVRVTAGGRSVQLVLNAALSQEGKKTIAREAACLEVLGKRFGHAGLPRIHAFGTAEIPGEDTEIPMFLGEWLAGYHEFHLSGTHRIRVWDPDDPGLFLSGRQAAALYRGVARLLTACYDFETSEHIASWHHAAGDFVVRLSDGDIDVRLITVRDYRPVFDLPENTREPSARTMLEALLVFFLHLLLHVRLDRIDGVGETVLAPSSAVSAATEGFFSGFDDWRIDRELGAGLAEGFREYVRRLSSGDIALLYEGIVDRMQPGSEERGVIERSIRDHVGEVRRVIASW